MSLNTFTPSVELGVVGGGVPVFLDQACTQRASLFDLNGNALKGNALVVPDNGIPPAFQCSATTVYFKHAAGIVSSLTSAGVIAATRAGGAALTVAQKVIGI